MQGLSQAHHKALYIKVLQTEEVPKCTGIVVERLYKQIRVILTPILSTFAQL